MSHEPSKPPAPPASSRPPSREPTSGPLALADTSLSLLEGPLQVFAEHRSIRFFRSEPLREGDLARIIAAGRRAPTDAQGQMYSFVRITDLALRREISELCSDQAHIREAAEFFVACLDVARLRRLVEAGGLSWGMKARIALIYGTSDAAFVAQNMVIAAEMLGYGTCYIGAIQNATDQIARRLHLPEGVLPLFGLCIGQAEPSRLPPLRPRLPAEVCFFNDRYPEGGLTEDKAKAGIAAMSGRRSWVEATLAPYFAAGGTMDKREEVMARAWKAQGFSPTDEQT